MIIFQFLWDLEQVSCPLLYRCETFIYSENSIPLTSLKCENVFSSFCEKMDKKEKHWKTFSLHLGPLSRCWLSKWVDKHPWHVESWKFFFCNLDLWAPTISIILKNPNPDHPVAHDAFCMWVPPSMIRSDVTSHLAIGIYTKKKLEPGALVNRLA